MMAGPRFLLRSVLWAAVLFAFVAAVMPHETAPTLGGSDKLNHVAAFLAITILALFAYPGLSFGRLLIATGLFGLVIELAQAIPALNRDSDARDWLADMAAVLLGMAIFHVWRRVSPG